MMIVLYIIIGIVALALIGQFLGGGQQAKKYGPARIFLLPILRKLQAEYPKHEMLTENDGRVKYRFYSTSYSFTTDFIYNPKHIQVAIAWDSIVNKAHKVENCPYDVNAIERAINDAFKYFLTPPH